MMIFSTITKIYHTLNELLSLIIVYYNRKINIKPANSGIVFAST